MTHPNFYRDDLRGQAVWRCICCPFDTFSSESMQEHARTHEPILLPDSFDPSTFNVPFDLSIVIGVLTSHSDWPTESIIAASQEASLLRKLGVKAQVYWVDNASPAKFRAQNLEYVHGHEFFDQNLGQSIARNHMIDYCMSTGADYLLMVDGNIDLIPYSAAAMASFMAQTNGIGCVGLYSGNCTDTPMDASTVCAQITNPTLGPGIAWTQYGMFRCSMFKELGIRFDESLVFQGPGWGFEDDDLGLQMMAAGYGCVNTKYYRYVHRRKHSSLAAMAPALAAKVFYERKAHLVRKWAYNPRTVMYANRIVNQTMPVVDRETDLR
jgi:hypothetical protein